MPTHALVQVAQAWDSALSRDHIVNTFSYRWADFTIQDAASLANNVLDAYETAFTPTGFPEFTAKVYDHEGTVPVLPMATVTRRPGVHSATADPREVALCLSFAGGQFQPRQRGRVYLHSAFLGSSIDLRPTPAHRDWLINFGKQLHAVGGANVDWIVWSRVNKSATSVSKIWVDDEWDTQRSRGLRATTRTEFFF